MEHPLTNYRKTKGLSIEAFAALVRSSKATISRVENGADLSFDLARRICEATGGNVTANDLLAATQSRPAENPAAGEAA